MASRIVNMTVPEDLIHEVDALARAEGRSRSELFREAARRYLEERKPFRKDSTRLLTRLRRLAAKGPAVKAQDIDAILYLRRSRR